MGVCKYWGPWVKGVRDGCLGLGVCKYWWPWIKGVWGWEYETGPMDERV